ncbi:archaetidylinositol phosphate synthase [Methanolinea mesophila]|uniref:CDP-alcohol phosphatidyltransferase family protein n=1 Tax=Methanolinea mesophila TaxID=547055 RepID=UPI001AE8CE61|nr:CDP-alcohol phosphatidyltransferase family protein [Methanolinea mesophila]MBP1929565.1 archaetidylinositol phosphate synthase [Methanolinea mesophila]
MTLDQFRPHVKDYFKPLIAVSLKLGLTPNILTVGSFIVAGFAGVAYFYENVLVGTLMVLLNAVFDSLDGALARAMNIQSPKGDFLDHVIDRYADIFIIVGIFAGGLAPWPIGVLALTGVLMSSYLGTQSQAVGVGRNYGGVLGRADRLVLILVAGFLQLAFPDPIFGLTLLAWLLLVFGIMGHITALQRFIFTWREMGKGGEKK